MLVSFNNFKIIKLSHKATSSEEIENNYQVVIDGIIENADKLVQNGKYGDINTTGRYIMGYYVIKLIPKPYALQ